MELRTHLLLLFAALFLENYCDNRVVNSSIFLLRKEMFKLEKQLKF